MKETRKQAAISCHVIECWPGIINKNKTSFFKIDAGLKTIVNEEATRVNGDQMRLKEWNIERDREGERRKCWNHPGTLALNKY